MLASMRLENQRDLQNKIADDNKAFVKLATEICDIKENLDDLLDSIEENVIFRTDAKDIIRKQIARLEALHADVV